jgi:hypothetical protein
MLRCSSEMFRRVSPNWKRISVLDFSEASAVGNSWRCQREVG